jgi:hypothetical protein
VIPQATTANVASGGTACSQAGRSVKAGRRAGPYAARTGPAGTGMAWAGTPWLGMGRPSPDIA